MTELQTMLAMVHELSIRIGAIEGELEQESLEMETGAARAADMSESIELLHQAEVLDDLRHVLESARLELGHIINTQQVSELAEAA